MSVTATGPIGLATQKLETLISTSTAFQTGCGVSSAADALRYIFYPEYQAGEDQDDKPFAVITPPQDAIQTERVAGGGKNYFNFSGSLDLHLAKEIKDFDNIKDEFVRFLNFAEGVWTHLLNYAAVDDNLAISDMPLVMITQSHIESVSGKKVQRAFFKALYSVQWNRC